MSPVRRLWLASVVLASLGPSLADAQTANCTTAGQNQFVRGVLREYYYWYRDLPDPDPASFPSPEAYLEAVRLRPQDASFSYISSEAESDAFFSESQYGGLGFRSQLVADDDLRLAEVFPGSPAAAAGLERNHRILEIEGRSVADLRAAGTLGTAFGPDTLGHVVRLRVQAPDGAVADVTLAKATVTIPTVAAARTFDVDGRRVGYLLFHNFVQPSIAALDAAFAQLAAEGATDLVLDLRYNGGGLVSVAQHLADLIGGARTNGLLMARYVHNDLQTGRNTSLFFANAPAALSAPRLVVITTGASASASELVINALRPYLPVAIVGSNTYGKPVGQYGFRFCGKIAWPVAFSIRNAADQGDYFGGLPPDCAAPDDLGYLLGDPREGSLSEALHYAATGGCSARASSVRRAARRLAQPHESNGFRRLLGAY
ncbi:MAG: S41 family peptidase [Vicinamibacteria bacterium]